MDGTFLRNAHSRDFADHFPRRWTHYRSNIRNFRESSSFTLSLYQTLQTQNNQPYNHNIMEYRKINSDWLQISLWGKQSGWLKRSDHSRDVHTSENPIKYVALNFRTPERTPLDPAASGTGSLEVAWSKSCCSQISLKMQQSNELIHESLAENKKFKQSSTASTDVKKVGKANK